MKGFTKVLLNGQIILQSEELSVWVAPERGMNVERLVWHGIDWIDCDETRRKNGAAYAVPILYPTPNRVKDDRFCFKGRTVAAQMHGPVRNCCFAVDQVQANEKNAQIAAHLDFLPGQDLYQKFPYHSRLNIIITAAQDSIRWDYEVQNFGNEELPYGIALHPFFKKNGTTEYRVNASLRMEADDRKLPTGKMLPIEPGKWDVCTLRSVESAVLDDVFCADAGSMAQFFYKELGVGLSISASEEFGRCVVYTPQEKDWFCLEPQTSSTNCHNLYSEGSIAAANLQIVEAYSTKKGFVKFDMIDLSKEGKGRSRE